MKLKPGERYWALDAPVQTLCILGKDRQPPKTWEEFRSLQVKVLERLVEATQAEEEEQGFTQIPEVEEDLHSTILERTGFSMDCSPLTDPQVQMNLLFREPQDNDRLLAWKRDVEDVLEMESDPPLREKNEEEMKEEVEDLILSEYAERLT